MFKILVYLQTDKALHPPSWGPRLHQEQKIGVSSDRDYSTWENWHNDLNWGEKGKQKWKEKQHNRKLTNHF